MVSNVGKYDMTDLVVRRLLIDLNRPFARYWNGSDPFRTALFNALSMSFPVGEQFFIDAVRAGLKTLPEAERAALAAEVQGFVGQEATHRRIHALFNQQLQQQGYVNHWAERAARRIRKAATLDPRIHVAATAATEHFTAILADWLLRHPQAFADAEPRLKTMWLWHASEESEHRSTAFNLYQAMGGDHAWRIRLFRVITIQFLSDLMRQTASNLWHDGQLLRWKTWRSAAGFLFGSEGMVRNTYQPWRRYFASDFHPDQQDAQRSVQWLRDNAAAYSVLGQSEDKLQTEGST
jgi:predicted metal-dependent hydrolase